MLEISVQVMGGTETIYPTLIWDGQAAALVDTQAETELTVLAHEIEKPYIEGDKMLLKTCAGSAGCRLHCRRNGGMPFSPCLPIHQKEKSIKRSLAENCTGQMLRRHPTWLPHLLLCRNPPIWRSGR